MLATPSRMIEFLGMVPVKLEQVIERPTITQLRQAGATISSLEAVLALEIAKAANALTVGGNLRQGQSLDIAKELIREYPHESIEDFCYCLRQGVKGKYSDKIYRFDVEIIHEWVKLYLDEKSAAQEESLMREKDDQYRNVKKTDSDWLKLMQDAIKKADEDGKKMETTPLRKTFIQDVRSITDKEIQQEGQKKPKSQPYPSTSRSEVEKFFLHRQWIAENFDARTGDKLPTWIEESEWIANQTK